MAQFGGNQSGAKINGPVCYDSSSFSFNDNRDIINDRQDLKLREAEKTIANKDVIIKMLQEQVKKMEEYYKHNIKETENFRYKYCLAVDQLKRLQNHSVNQPQCGWVSKKPQYQPVSPRPEPPASDSPRCQQNIQNLENLMRQQYEIMKVLVDRVMEQGQQPQTSKGLLQLQDEIFRLKIENAKLQDQIETQVVKEFPQVKDSVLETYKKRNSLLTEKLEQFYVDPEQDQSTMRESGSNDSPTDSKKVSFSGAVKPVYVDVDPQPAYSNDVPKSSASCAINSLSNNNIDLVIDVSKFNLEEKNNSSKPVCVYSQNQIGRLEVTPVKDNYVARCRKCGLNIRSLSPEKDKSGLEIVEKQPYNNTPVLSESEQSNSSVFNGTDGTEININVQEQNFDNGRGCSRATCPKKSTSAPADTQVEEFHAIAEKSSRTGSKKSDESPCTQSTCTNTSSLQINRKSDGSPCTQSTCTNTSSLQMNRKSDGRASTQSTCTNTSSLQISRKSDGSPCAQSTGSKTNFLESSIKSDESPCIQSTCTNTSSSRESTKLVSASYDSTKHPKMISSATSIDGKLTEIRDMIVTLMEKQESTCHELQVVKQEIKATQESTEDCNEELAKLKVTVERQKNMFMGKVVDNPEATNDLQEVKEVNAKITGELNYLKEKIEILYKNLEGFKSRNDGATKKDCPCGDRLKEKPSVTVKTKHRVSLAKRDSEKQIQCLNDIIHQYNRINHDVSSMYAIMSPTGNKKNIESCSPECDDDADFGNYLDKMREENYKLKRTISTVLQELQCKMKGLCTGEGTACSQVPKVFSCLCISSLKGANSKSSCTCYSDTSISITKQQQQQEDHPDVQLEDVYEAVLRAVAPCKYKKYDDCRSVSCPQSPKPVTNVESCPGAVNIEDVYKAVVCSRSGKECTSEFACSSGARSVKSCLSGTCLPKMRDDEDNPPCCGLGHCLLDFQNPCKDTMVRKNLENYVKYLQEQLHVICNIETQIEDLRVEIKTPGAAGQ